MSQVPNAATCFDISPSEFLESDILEVEVLLEYYLFYHKMN